MIILAIVFFLFGYLVGVARGIHKTFVYENEVLERREVRCHTDETEWIERL